MRYIFAPDSYIYLAKSDWIQEFMLSNQDEMDKNGKIALGGIYSSINEDEKFIYLSNGKKILKSLVIPYEENKFNYKINDVVIFDPICSESEKKYLLLLNRFKIHEEYKIYRIINSYYVELINEKGEISNPIRFCDIKPISR